VYRGGDLMPATNQDPGGCQCTEGPACAVAITGHVTGCGGLSLAGCTVEAHDGTTGGTLLGTTTTDASGNYSLTGLDGTVGNAIVVVFKKSPRFTQATTTLAYHATDGTSTTWSCGKTSSGVNKALTAASGYQCLSACADPVSETLYLTDSMYGATTIAWTGGGWGGGKTVAFGGSGAGCGDCPPDATIAVQYFMTALTAGLSVSIKQVSGCPDHTGFVATMADKLPVIICPPSFSAVMTPYPSAAGYVDAFYDCSGATLTVTEIAPMMSMATGQPPAPPDTPEDRDLRAHVAKHGGCCDH
jgi:hypothetical protein